MQEKEEMPVKWVCVNTAVLRVVVGSAFKSVRVPHDSLMQYGRYRLC